MNIAVDHKMRANIEEVKNAIRKDHRDGWWINALPVAIILVAEHPSKAIFLSCILLFLYCKFKWNRHPSHSLYQYVSRAVFFYTLCIFSLYITIHYVDKPFMIYICLLMYPVGGGMHLFFNRSYDKQLAVLKSNEALYSRGRILKYRCHWGPDDGTPPGLFDTVGPILLFGVFAVAYFILVKEMKISKYLFICPLLNFCFGFALMTMLTQVIFIVKYQKRNAFILKNELVSARSENAWKPAIISSKYYYIGLFLVAVVLYCKHL